MNFFDYWWRNDHITTLLHFGCTRTTARSCNACQRDNRRDVRLNHILTNHWNDNVPQNEFRENLMRKNPLNSDYQSPCNCVNNAILTTTTSTKYLTIIIFEQHHPQRIEYPSEFIIDGTTWELIGKVLIDDS